MSCSPPTVSKGRRVAVQNHRRSLYDWHSTYTRAYWWWWKEACPMRGAGGTRNTINSDSFVAQWRIRLGRPRVGSGASCFGRCATVPSLPVVLSSSMDPRAMWAQGSWRFKGLEDTTSRLYDVVSSSLYNIIYIYQLGLGTSASRNNLTCTSGIKYTRYLGYRICLHHKQI